MKPSSCFALVMLRARGLRFRSACGVALLILAFWEVDTSTAFAADGDRVCDDISVSYNLRYREGLANDWVLDLAMQKDYAGEPRPAIIVIHGGGWLAADM